MSEDLIYLIEQASLGTYGTDLFKGSRAVIPNGPGPYTTVVETGGAPPEGTHNMTAAPAYVRPSAQIVVRAKDYDVADTLAKQIWDMLYPVTRTGGGQMINGTWWVSLQLVQRPFDLGLDSVGRPRVAFNVDAVKRLSPATS